MTIRRALYTVALGLVWIGVLPAFSADTYTRTEVTDLILERDEILIRMRPYLEEEDVSKGILKSWRNPQLRYERGEDKSNGLSNGFSDGGKSGFL